MHCSWKFIIYDVTLQNKETIVISSSVVVDVAIIVKWSVNVQISSKLLQK